MGYMGWIWGLAMGLYSLNLLVGLAAQLRLAHFGVWHHLLYLGVVVSTLAALWFVGVYSLMVTLICLALLPRSRPGGWQHPALGLLGYAGYIWPYLR